MEVEIKKLLIILYLTLGLTTAANANAKYFAVGDVFYCDTLKSVGWVWADEKQFKNYKLENFKFSVIDEKTIKFGKGGYFDDYEMEIEDMFGLTLMARTSIGRLLLGGIQLTYSSADYNGGSFQTATCDRF